MRLSGRGRSGRLPKAAGHDRTSAVDIVAGPVRHPIATYVDGRLEDLVDSVPEQLYCRFAPALDPAMGSWDRNPSRSGNGCDGNGCNQDMEAESAQLRLIHRKRDMG